ncbi:MAG: hypothetical protein ACJ8HI_05100 [Massilia sp.]
MKTKVILSATLFALCGVVGAQTVTESTDPAKIAEIERHAQQLSSSQMSSGSGEHMDGMHHKKMHARHMRHAKKMKAAQADAAASDTPMAEPAK